MDFACKQACNVKEGQNLFEKAVFIMKKLLNMKVLILVLGTFSTINAQNSGVLWIKSFEPGSSDLTEPGINKAALATLDSLMQDESIEVTFLGAADEKSWRMEGKAVHPYISEAWNDAKRLSRARSLKERYGRGNIGITHEAIAGVKVLWTKVNTDEMLTAKLNHLTTQLAQVKQELEDARTHGTNGHSATNGHNGKSDITIKKSSLFDWKLQTGMWSWTSGSNTLVSPSLALSIMIGNTAFVMQGGVTPWQLTSADGNQAHSFVNIGAKHMKTDAFGFSLTAFRGWKFYTSNDTWSFTTMGVAGGVVLKYKIFEFQPNLTYSRSSSLEDEDRWKIGTSLGISININ